MRPGHLRTQCSHVLRAVHRSRGWSPRRDRESAALCLSSSVAGIAPSAINRLIFKVGLDVWGVHDRNADRPFLRPLPIPHARSRAKAKNLVRSLVSNSILAKIGNRYHSWLERKHLNPVLPALSMMSMIAPAHACFNSCNACFPSGELRCLSLSCNCGINPMQIHPSKPA